MNWIVEPFDLLEIFLCTFGLNSWSSGYKSETAIILCNFFRTRSWFSFFHLWVNGSMNFLIFPDTLREAFYCFYSYFKECHFSRARADQVFIPLNQQNSFWRWTVRRWDEDPRCRQVSWKSLTTGEVLSIFSGVVFGGSEKLTTFDQFHELAFVTNSRIVENGDFSLP